MIAQLRQLAIGLVACSTRDTTINQKRFLEGWQKFRALDLEGKDEITPAVMAGMLLFDHQNLASLVTPEEHIRLAEIAGAALERYQQRIKPNNPVGSALAGVLAEYQ